MKKQRRTMNNFIFSFEIAREKKWAMTYLQSSDMLLVSNKIPKKSFSKEFNDGLVIYFEDKEFKNIAGLLIEDVTTSSKKNFLSNIVSYIRSKGDRESVKVPLEKRYFQDLSQAMHGMTVLA